jgi:cell wall assembly regulator SMI1
MLLLAGLGILILVLLVGAGILMVGKFNKLMYPTAPHMPAVVSQSSEEILARLESVLREKAPQVLTNLQPGLSMNQINDLEQKSGIRIPEEIKALYHWRDGFNREAINAGKFQIAGPIPGHFFLPLEDALKMPGILSNQVAGATSAQRVAFNAVAGYTKNWVTLFDDGAGDGYFFDPSRKPEQGAVFYHFAEEAQYVFFPSAKNLYAGIVKGYEENVFTWQEGTNGPSLNEDYTRADKLWDEFGASPPQ